ncbi:MAG: hypothetical protein ABS862_01665 [Carnobacterium inhibens]|uniref:hypothetical protein n=1 Tax=Carnobacterium sp. TaxID=48221 RepID=UPI0033147141
MIFTLTDRDYNVLDAYETDDYLIGNYIGTIIKSLDINVLVKSENAKNWTYGNYIMCEDQTGYKYWFTIYDSEDSYTADEKNLMCYSGTIDIVSEDANPIGKPSEPQPFTYYFNRIFNDTGITIGVNELTGLSRSLEYTSESVSNAEMLQYVLNGFDNAEADLAVEFKGSTPTALVLNVFKRIGEEEPQTTLTDEDDSLTSLDRTGSISDLATCLNPVGANEEETETPITLAGNYYEELDENGNILYYSPTSHARVYSVEGRRNFYVQLPNKKNGEFDGYINRRYTSQASSKDALWKESLVQLKKIDQPTVTYEAKGSIDCQIGDNIQIVSNELQPPVMISARVLEYKFNDDNPTLNEYKFGNYQELESNIDQLSKMMEEIKKSIIFISSQVVEYVLSDQGDTVPPDGWTLEQPAIEPGNWLWIRTTTNLSNGDQTVSYAVSYAGSDGKDGKDGEQGPPGLNGLQGDQGEQGLPGLKGADGKTQYTHIAYANSSDGSVSFSTSVSLNKLYIGMYVDFTANDSSNPSLYNWTLIKGADGTQGIPGVKGSDGQTSYLHIAYAANSTGTAGFSTTVSAGKTYIGQYTDFISADSNDPAKYAWTLIKGEKGDTGEQGPQGLQGLQGTKGDQGLPGSKGADGKTQYTHIAYATNSTGTAGFSTSDSTDKTYIGMYVDFTEADSSTPSMYNWTLIKGADGSQGIPGVKGPDGQTSYLHIAYATNATGTAGFSTTVSAGKTYIGQYTDFASADSTDPAKYAWTLIKGDKGDTGATGPKGDTGSTGSTGAAGQNAITGYLTNESLILPANPSGVVSSYSGANGYFRIMDGNSQALSGITFSLVSATGITTAINASGYFAVTAMSADVGTATYRAVYKGVTIEKIIMVVKNKQGVTGATGATGSPGTNGKDGATGPQGPATGITQQATVPTGPYVGMLWKNTGASGYINGVTYRWNGSKWEIFLMSVENLSVTNLAAIASTLGAVTNPFTGVISEGGILDGNTTISDAFVKIKGTERTSKQQFGTELGPLNLYSYLSNSIGVIQSFFDLSSNGLNMYTNGIGSGSISAEQLIAVPFTNIPLSAGFITKENNPPQYRVTKALDGSYQCEIVGQVGLSSGDMGTTMRYNAGTLPVNARPLRNEFFYAPTDRMGGRLAVTTAGVVQLSLAAANEYAGLSARFVCKGPLT